MKYLLILALIPFLVESKYKINVKELKCLVCEAMLEELEFSVSNLDPAVKVDVGGYRIDSTGNVQRKEVSQSKSEVQLSEIADSVCDRMDDYIRATYKSNGKLMLLKMITSDGKMNSDFSNVDIIQDDDLNKSLKYYCEEIFGDHEDSIIGHYVKSSDNIPIRVCSLEAKLCKKTLQERASEDL